MSSALMLVVTAVASAQHTVHVSTKDDTPGFITSAIKARIGASSRYALTDSTGDSELVLNLLCHDTKPVVGFMCVYNVGTRRTRGGLC